MSMALLTPPALELTGISKSFGNARVLNDVSIALRRGEILGLLGHNGSGKSTLIKCLAGFHQPDGVSDCRLDGEPYRVEGSGTGQRIAFVHQDLGLINDLNVLENFLLADRRAMAASRIAWTPLRAGVAQALSDFGLRITPEDRVADLSQAERCLISIVRALETFGGDVAGKVLVLDEPTPFLPAEGVAQLFALMRSFTARGGAILFVAHDIDEVREITDRIVVLRDGRKVADFVTRETSREAVIEAIVGRSLEQHQCRRASVPQAEAQATRGWRVEDLRGAGLSPMSLALGRGEILGVTGLAGSGAAELPELLTGARRAEAGRITGPEGKAIALPRVSVRQLIDHGIALLPDDRLRKSGIGALTLAENIALPALPRFAGALGLRLGAMAGHVDRVVEGSGILPPDPVKTLQSFSGGNQQKALIHKWLALTPGLLVLSEPTQGVDVGSRQAIYAAIETAAARGTSVLCYSSDAGELAQICDRILVFSGGEITAEVTGADITKDSIVAASLGVQGAGSPAQEITT